MTSKQVARFSLLVALAMVLSWLDSLIPVSSAVPGVKLGLANLVVIFALYCMRLREAVLLSLVRVLLVSLTFGNAYAFAYSLAGAVLSLGAMVLLKKSGLFSPVGVSVAGGVCHNIGQILVAMVVLETGRLICYLPVLLVSGLAAGVAIGVVGAIIVKRIPITES